MTILLLWALSTVVGCDDYVLPAPVVDTAVVGGDGWCAVESTIRSHCLDCHGAAALGELDLSEDPHAALVGVASATSPALTLVVPGAPDESFLLRKLEGPLAATEGGSMPPGRALAQATIDQVRTWIADGATDACEVLDTSTTTGRHHPDDQADPSVHGQDAKLGTEPCIACHGADLTGVGTIPGCDDCHSAGWRTDCTFCHGDPADGSGAPPVHLSGVDDGSAASFIPHRTHLATTTLHTAFPCETCHVVPTDVLSEGHVFVSDDTPGVADVSFAAGLSAAARWDGTNGTCSNLYCHGSGRGPDGVMVHTDTIQTCHDCHADMSSGRAGWARMSAWHEKHLREGVTCKECHPTTTDDSSIATVSEHVNGTVEVALPAPMQHTTTCNGACHGENHEGERWR